MAGSHQVIASNTGLTKAPLPNARNVGRTPAECVSRDEGSSAENLPAGSSGLSPCGCWASRSCCRTHQKSWGQCQKQIPDCSGSTTACGACDNQKTTSSHGFLDPEKCRQETLRPEFEGLSGMVRNACPPSVPAQSLHLFWRQALQRGQPWSA